jgi:serine/threonine-protein kinase
MPLTSTAELVAALRTAHVLDAARLDEVARTLQGQCLDAHALARELLQRGWLTGYQANQLLQGRGAELVLGPYVMLDRLGEGGMGQVFKAHHQLMNRTVAVKVIRKDLLAHPDAVQRFYREIRLAAQLDHPHLVRAHDAAQVGDTHFLVMEYVEGTDLQQMIQKKGPLPVALACAYVGQAALGLHHAAERGLVHRDIKPSNLQVTAKGTVVKILDMGMARSQVPDADGRRRPELTQARSVLGTPDYIAPEQIADPRRVDIRADLYSLGCTLYFLLAGRPPFPGGAWEEKLYYHRNNEPQPIEQLRPDVPPELGAVLRKMMAKRPEDRYATAAGAADALKPFCQKAATVPAMTTPAPAPWPQPATVGGPPIPGGSASLADRPAAGYEPGWTLGTTSTVVPPSVTPTRLEPVTPSSVPPLSWPPPPISAMPGQPGPAARNWLWPALAGGGILCSLVLLVILLWPKGNATPIDKGKDTVAEAAHGKNEQPKQDAPRDFIKEDFTKPNPDTGLPEGWEGNAFRVARLKEFGDKPCLEVNKPTGAYEVKLPPVSLPGNFLIEGVYHYPHPSFVILLETSKANAPLVVRFDYYGNVAVADDQRKAPQNYKVGQPTPFRLVRKGMKLIVKLNDELVSNWDLKAVIEYESIKLVLPAASFATPRLFGLTVSTLGVDGAAPPSNMPVPAGPGGPKKKK